MSAGVSVGGALALALGLFGSTAHAQSLSACGQDMYIGVEADCQVIPPAECVAMCEPFRLEAACAAELSVMCQAQCNLQAEASCTGSCQADCQADCQATPGQFECAASCRGECEADCSARCGGSGDSTCEASCRASCSGSCDASCNVTPPSASCEAKCQASCSGSCKAKVNADCQIGCQKPELYVDCQARLQGGCEVSCMSNPDGGLFCDGQFVKSNNVDECVAAIKNLLDANVTVYAEGSASCMNGECMFGGEAGGSCAALPGKKSATGALSGLLTFGLLAVLRRRRRRV